MRQQIDLYQDILIDRPEPLQRRQAGYIILIAIIGLILVSGFSYRQVAIAKAERNGLFDRFQIENKRVTDLEQQYPEVKMNVLLKEKIVRLEQEIRGQRQALNYFSEQDMESNTDILATLDGLAKTPFKGVWLKRIRLMERGEEVLLAGSARSAEQVPDYLALLGSQHIFGGRLFSRLQVNRVEKLADQVDFLLESSQEGGL